MRFSNLLIWFVLFLTGCLSPGGSDPRGVSSPMLAAYQAAMPQEKINFWTLPLTPQSQAYALTGGILILMIFVILKASQSKD